MDFLNKTDLTLYFLTFVSAFVISLILTPAARAAATTLNILDHPHSDVKTHKMPTPYLGGVAIFLAFSLSLLWLRVLTSFPTGTLRSLRGILIGGAFIFSLGLIDDVLHKGLHYRTKFFFQFAGALMLMLFGIQLKFIHPTWFALIVSGIWIVGVTNAFNLIDIMDGLASGTTFVAALAFFFISLPTEEIYVNFAALALAGAVLGFLPFNLSKKRKIFMGDCGSLFLGFVASALALGTSYKGQTNLNVLVPLMILAIPIFDTLLVFILRIMRGKPPFMGSKDHFPLRLEILGWKRRNILIAVLLFAIIMSGAAFFVTKGTVGVVVGIYLSFAIFLGLFTRYILKAKVE